MYAFELNGKTFLPTGQTDVNAAEHNARIETAELDAWSKAPNAFCAYAVGNKITTWRGVEIGTVIASNTYRTNISRAMRSIRVRGTNGAEYHGRYGSDWSQLVRLRKCK